MLDLTAQHQPFDVQEFRNEFPILNELVNGKRFSYLDNGVTSQRPRAVADAVQAFQLHFNANIHRGTYWHSVEATRRYEAARTTVAELLHATSAREVLFTRGTTEALNLVAASWGRSVLKSGDQIVLTELEHHSNIVPWQMVAADTGAEIKVVPMQGDGSLDLERLSQLLRTGKVKVVGVTHVSNALGTVNPVREICTMAHEYGAIAVVDGAQAVAHMLVDVQEIGADFYAFSGHKMFADFGIGALWGREELLKKMPPYMGGGDMIHTVSFERTTYAELPAKFEAGTPNVSGAIGLHAAVQFIADQSSGESTRERLAKSFARFEAHEQALWNQAVEGLKSEPGVKVFPGGKHPATLFSFTIDGVHPHDIGTVLDTEGVAIRAGHHCCQPLMKVLKVPATARVSFGPYNTSDDVKSFLNGVRKVRTLFC